MAGQPNGSPRSVAVAERALELIKRHNLSADPAGYAVWYAYVEGTNPAVARSIDGFIASKGNLSDGDIHDIRHRHLSGLDTVARLRVIGDNLSDEVEQIVGMIEASIGIAGSVEQDLTDASRKLALAIDRDTLRSIVEAVLSATKDMQQENAKFRKSSQTVARANLRTSTALNGNPHRGIDRPTHRPCEPQAFRCGAGRCTGRGRTKRRRVVATNCGYR